MKIELPHVGESVTEGIIGKWLKNIGDRVEKYDPLVEVVTDKVSMEMPSPVSGTLTSILVEEGQTVPMGTVIAEIAVEGEVGDAGAGPRPAHAETVRQEEGRRSQAPPRPQTIDRIGTLLRDVAPVGPTGSGGPITTGQPDAEVALKPTQEEAQQRPRRRYSPAVLRLAQEHGVDLSQVRGTGINGRITRKDVQAFIEAREKQVREAAPVAPMPSEAAGPGEERVPLTPVRRMIAENMVRSAAQIPAAWTIVEVDVTGLVQRREAVKADFQRREGVNITYLPFVVKAVAESLKENPLLNSSWGGDSIILKKRINIGIAVAAPSGLVVPVIRDADTLSIAGLAKKLDELTARARQGKLALQDVQGGTFTVNNTGALGSIASQPIINYPQAAILTTEAIVKRPVIINDAIAIRSMMNVCLTFDHRIMDGAEASAFVSAIKRRLEAIGAETGIY